MKFNFCVSCGENKVLKDNVCIDCCLEDLIKMQKEKQNLVVEIDAFKIRILGSRKDKVPQTVEDWEAEQEQLYFNQEFLEDVIHREKKQLEILETHVSNMYKPTKKFVFNRDGFNNRFPCDTCNKYKNEHENDMCSDCSHAHDEYVTRGCDK